MKKLFHRFSFFVLFLILFSNISFAEKKGGESCEKDSDCQTNSCQSGKCDPCPDANRCPAPGTCSESELGSLRDEVTRWCKGPERSCANEEFNDKEVYCGGLKARLEVAQKCVEARSKVMNQCFKGGDSAHRDERQTAAEVADRCKRMIEHKQGVKACYDCSPSDYESYQRDMAQACAKQLSCEERKDDSKTACGRIEEKIKNSEECIKNLDYLVGRCFDGRRNWRYDLKKQEAEKASGICKEVLDYKKDKSLCE